MSTQNNTLTNPDVSDDRKQECEAELIESPPSTTTYAYNKELGLGSEEKPTDDEQTDDAFSSTKSDTEARDLAEDALVPEEGKDAADTKTKEVVEPSTEEKMAQQITDVSVPPLIQTQPQQIYKPNTITILVNTKIRNHRMLYYKPYMTVPGEMGKNVCFDPLVMLNQSVVSNIPPNEPEDELYTQFFRRNQFNSLLKRTLAKSMQPIYTFEEARKDGVTDNNIHVTLDTLFKQGNTFYIGGEPYVINSYDWIQGDWQVDSRPNYEQKIRFLPYGVSYPKNYVHQFSRQAERERATIPVEALKGDALESSSKIKKAIESAAGTIVHQPGVTIGDDVDIKMIL